MGRSPGLPGTPGVYLPERGLHDAPVADRTVQHMPATLLIHWDNEHGISSLILAQPCVHSIKLMYILNMPQNVPFHVKLFSFLGVPHSPLLLTSYY